MDVIWGGDGWSDNHVLPEEMHCDETLGFYFIYFISFSLQSLESWPENEIQSRMNGPAEYFALKFR